VATEQNRAFVFHDPTGRRWMRFQRTAQSFAIVAGIGLTLFILSMIVLPALPNLGLPSVSPVNDAREVAGIIKGQKAERNIPYQFQKDMKRDAKKIDYVRSNSPVIHPKNAARATDGKPVVFGYYVNWDPASQTSLRASITHLTHLIPEWFYLKNAQGDLEDQTDATIVAIARQSNLPILAEVNNNRDGWQTEEIHQVLSHADRRANLIDNIYSNLREHKFAGVNIDFESLNPRDREPLVTFMKELSAKLKPAGLLVTQSVPPDDPAFDLKRLIQYEDYLMVMVYDEHEQSSAPGPVASQSWYDDRLERLAKLLPAEKTVIGVGSYGYDWIIDGTGGTEVKFSDVMAAAIANDAKIEWDGDTSNPVLRYKDKTKTSAAQHEVWFLDAVTALNEVQDVSDQGFRGIGIWRLGAEDPDFWKVVNPSAWPSEKFDVKQLAVLTAQQVVNHYGAGDIIQISETPREGARTVTAPKSTDGDYAEKFQSYPTYYVVDRSGDTESKEVCLSFDDGPDPNYTPRILDILKAKHVPASFFLVGVNAEAHPSIVKREYAEGMELGNHTYSHPNIATTSELRTKYELAFTQRIVENAIGHSTILFRPPYNADSEPSTAAEIVPIYRAQQYGFLTVGESIDPRDWEPGTSAAHILQEVKDEEDNGQIILLHDAGGDRNATVEALPRIIDYYQSRGYRFVRVGDLVGKTRAQVMPVPTAEEMRWAQIEGGAFDLKSNLKSLLGVLFLSAIALTMARSLFFGVLAVMQKRRAGRMRFEDALPPPVSVIVAAFNEEKVIVRTVESILNNGYSDLEIVVVDDGSKDATLAVLRQRFCKDPRVMILTQPNGGKSAALNNAIAHSQHQILIAVDADTLFRKGTIQKLTRHFADPNVGAVSGNARVGNRGKLLTRFQSIEYIYGFNLDRRALDLLNAITVVPGAVGAWRKDLIQWLGGFGHDTLAEDADLTMAIRRLGYKIRYEQDAIAYTEAPEDLRGLAKQRFRWAFGTLQAAWKHRDALFVPKYGTLGFVALPSIWLFQVLLSVLSPFAEISMIVALFAGNWRIVLLYYLTFFVVELLTGFLAYALEGEKPWDLTLLFFQRIYFRQLMHYVLLKSLIFAMRGRLVGWGKLERRATVTQS
jgi:cellulose synthase/poly-beta-1,6-N-acetylglucosamine synthase-like glycosyltransferase/spore germination protein YaaH/peptidoglycan/xylan/chitin deacetylase (PgdA/CDA1 family)